MVHRLAIDLSLLIDLTLTDAFSLVRSSVCAGSIEFMHQLAPTMVPLHMAIIMAREYSGHPGRGRCRPH